MTSRGGRPVRCVGTNEGGATGPVYRFGKRVAERTEELSRTTEELKSQIAERQRAQDAERHLVEEMAVVDRVARIVTPTLEVDKVYEGFAIEVKKLLDWDRMVINVVDEEANVYTFKYSAGLVQPDHEIPNVRPLEGSQTHYVLVTRQTLFTSDIATSPNFKGTKRFLKMGLHASITVPLISQGRVLGAMTLRSQRVGAYTDEEKTILERLAGQIAPALENATLYEATRLSQEHQQRLAQEEATLAEIGRIISSSLEVDNVYDRFGGEIQKLIPYDRLGVGLIDQER